MLVKFDIIEADPSIHINRAINNRVAAVPSHQRFMVQELLEFVSLNSYLQRNGLFYKGCYYGCSMRTTCKYSLCHFFEGHWPAAAQHSKAWHGRSIILD